jgi:hypothetical protein
MKKENWKETRKIDKVEEYEDSYTITQGIMCCGLSKKYGVIPKVNDQLTIHTKGGAFGTIRGMDLNGEKIFWKTDEDLEAERVEWLRKHEEEKQQRFKDNVAKMDETYNSLPKCFQERIDRFRTNNDRFRIDYEEYELFCCTEAIKVANACKTTEKIDAFVKMKYEEQIKLVNLDEGHSGNTFGACITLAYLFLTEPENVCKVYGSMSNLVGSVEYGDVPKS